MEIKNQLEIQELKISGVMGLIRSCGRISRKEIARAMNLPPSTVTMVTQFLIERGFVRSAGFVRLEGGGRRPELLEINPDGGFILCLDLGRSVGVVGLFDLTATERELTSYDFSGLKDEHLYAAIVESIDRFTREYGDDRILGIGVSVPGFVSNTGIVVKSIALHMVNFPLRDRLEERFGKKVVIVNDINAACFAEYEALSESNISNMMFVYVDEGIGSGFIINRELYIGTNGMAGELDHVFSGNSSVLCTCGKVGCLGTVAQSSSIIKRYNAENKGLSRIFDNHSLLNLVRMGDESATRMTKQAIDALSRTICNFAAVLTLDTVVVKGYLFDDEVLYQMFLDTVADSVPSELFRFTQIRRSRITQLGELKGVASMVLHDFP